MDLCQSCSKRSKDTCSRCHCSRYCSKQCQKADWPTHKLLCRDFSAMDLTSRPSDKHFLGIVFPPDQNKPRLTWLHCPIKFDYQSPAPQLHLMAQDDCNFDIQQTQYNATLDRSLSNAINYMHRDTFFLDGSLPNRAARTVTKQPDMAPFDYRGPMVMYSTAGHESKRCRDIDLLDFRHGVDFLRRKSTPLGIRRPPKPANVLGGPLPAVRIHCRGAQATYGAPPFEAVTAVETLYFYAHRPGPSIPARVGLPLLTMRDPLDDGWTGADPAANPAAASLHLSCADDDTWGSVTAPCNRADGAVGSVLVARVDGQPLHPLQLDALVRFCQQLDIAPGSGATTRREILAAITKPAFDAFQAKFFRDKLGGGVCLLTWGVAAVIGWSDGMA